MQSAAASRRAFSYLASKIHPQLPLSPRESQQLLTLLTTSFRAHLDREHPITLPDSGHEASSRKQLILRSSQNEDPKSSRTTASKHIDSILNNPLFSSVPQRRTSEPRGTDVQEVLRDPMGWFMGQVAIGAADVQKAATCLEILVRNAASADLPASTALDTQPGTRIADWLWSSGLETSRAFVGSPSTLLTNRLVPLLVTEGGEGTVWRWIAYDVQSMISDTGLSQDQILVSKARLLKLLVSTKLANGASIDGALADFLRASKMFGASQSDMANVVLRSAGALLVNHIFTRPQFSGSTQLYEAFQETTASGWAKSYTKVIQSLLWLQHPTRPTAAPGLKLLTEVTANQATTAYLKVGSQRKQQFYVQLCLGVARQLLAESKFADAQFALEVARNNFPELVSEPKEAPTETQQNTQAHQKAQWKQRREQQNLQLLDSLLPG